jgi:PAS domain S-box-containing protein
MKERKIRLLLIEDDKIDQMAFERSVKKNDLPYDYSIAGSIAEARKITRSTNFDVIISDYMLGDGVSFELFELYKELPVIITTGTGNEEVAVEAMKLGAYDYLIKDPEGNYLKTLPATVELAIKRKQNENQLQIYQENLESMVKERTVKLQAEIVERKKAEKALKESELKFRILYNNSPDMYASVSPDGGSILMCNETILKKTGYLREEIIGFHIFKLYHDDCLEDAKKLFQQFVNKGVLRDKELILKKKDGSKLDVNLNVNSVRDETGKILYSITSWRDITDRKRLEKERKQIEEQYRQAQKMEAIGVLAGGLAHDFNNLLTIILGNLGLLLMDDSMNDSDKKVLLEIETAGQRAVDLVRQLLAFSRKQVIRPQILMLNILLKNTEKMLNRLIDETIEIKMIQDPELWKIKIDPGQVDQVVMNLAVNARDAMPNGGRISFKTANVDLDINWFNKRGIEPKPGQYVMLAVSDNGHGMDNKTLKKIFEPFFSTKEIGKGTGLGLSTVYGIIKQNKGLIWVKSKPGQGTTFKIYLPKESREEKTRENKKISKPGHIGSETIFIVEDDDNLRKFIQKILHNFGYNTLIAENGEHALKVVKENDISIHLMITDVIMPKMNGKELSDKIQILYPDIKVIFMSGYTDNAISSQGVLEPGLNFLEKPFTAEGLNRKIREVLDNDHQKF